MADSSGQEKTEKATPKKRRDARSKGQVFQSKDLVSVASIFVCFYTLKAVAPYIVSNMSEYMVSSINSVSSVDAVNFGSLQRVLQDVGLYMIKCCGVLLIVSMLISIVAVGAQTKFNFAKKALKPDFSKLNPLKGLKNMFSLKNLLELVKNLAKVVLLIYVSYDIIKKELVNVPVTMNMDIKASSAYLFASIMKLVTKVSLAFLIISIVDLLYQRWNYEKELMMTKQELKEEFKQIEGNPEIKGKIKEMQRQRSRQRMMQSVPDADVIIRNPTHYAVALRYDYKKDPAPIVLAKGADSLALRIVNIGEQNGIYTVENKALARSIYSKVEIGHPIEPEHYAAVADLLIYVFKLQNKLEEAIKG